MNAVREIAESMAANMAEIDRKLSTPATVKYITNAAGKLVPAAQNRDRYFDLGYHPDDLGRPINDGEGEL